MSEQQEQLTDALLAVHAARRTLHIARERAQRAELMGAGIIDDLVQALAVQVANAERYATQLVGPGFRLDNGASISVVRDDRRAMPRPRYLYAPAGRSAQTVQAVP